MGTGLDGALEDSTAGIIPRAVSLLQSRLSSAEPGSYELYTSFLEIYNEEIIDLLNRSQQADCRSRKGILAVREDAQGGIFVTGIKEEQCATANSILECLRNGSLCRTTKSTQMNLVSSRSHAILTISLRRRMEDGSGKSAVSKLHFVDLAGSERLKRTQAQGDRAKESISINGGLLALGNVISALGDTSKKATHVPYRDSKLTRLLQDSLGGNSRTLMLACVSPSSDNLAETLNTLKYAHRARNIKNRVQQVQDAEGDAAFECAQLKKQVSALKQQLNQLRTAPMRSEHPKDGGLSSTSSAVSNARFKQENDDLKRRLEVMTREKRLAEQERDALRREMTMDPTKSPKTKEYLKTISELRSRLVQLENAKEASAATPTQGMSNKPARRNAPGIPSKLANGSPIVERVEPGTPTWFHAADDLLGRAKAEIEQAYDAMDGVLEAPTAFLSDDVDADPDGDANVMDASPLISHAQLAAAVATRTEAALAPIRTDLQLRAELVQQIETCKQEFLFMRSRFEERIALLQNNMKSIQQERDQALTNNSTGLVSSEARVGLNRMTRQKYEERIKKMGKELNELKDRLRAALHTTSSKSSASDCLVRNLRAQLSTAKAENTRLQSQLSDQLGRLRTDASAQDQELADLRQSARRAQDSSTKWRRAHEFQKALLQKRIEQCLHARAKIRQLVQLLRRNRVNLASPSAGIDWASPGWKALQADHPTSPLLPARLTLKKRGEGSTTSGEDVDEVPMASHSPVQRFPPISQLGLKSVSAQDLQADGGLAEEEDQDMDLAEATSQLVIDSEPGSDGPSALESEPTSPFLINRSFTAPPKQFALKPAPSSIHHAAIPIPAIIPQPSTNTSELPKSILRASPLLPRRRDFFGRLAEAALTLLSPSKAPPAKKPNNP